MNPSTGNRSSLTHNQIRGSIALAAAMLLGGLVTTVEAAKVSRPVLKSFFIPGAKPSSAQFSTMIDSVVNISEDRYLLGLRVYDITGKAALLSEGTVVEDNSGTPFGPVEGLDDVWAGQSGYLALAFSENSQTHYGYLQLSAGEPGGLDLYPMFVEYFVYEDVAGQPLVITSVPEPSTLTLAAVCGAATLFGVLRRRRARR